MSHREVFSHSPRYRYEISGDRTFYLDTSVLRRRVSTLSGSLLASCSYTSALAIIELISRARRSERDYRPVRAVLTAIFDAGLVIDWRLPDVQIRTAFPQSRPRADIYDTRAESLRVIVGAIVATPSRGQFLEVADRLNIPQGMTFFESYDSDYGQAYLEALKGSRSKSKSLFDPSSVLVAAVAQVFGLSDEVAHDDYIRALRRSKLNRAISRYVIAEIVREADGAPEAQQQEFFMSYDGSIDPYLHALAWSHFEVLLGRYPGRNDALDLAHLLYLVPGAGLVTADRALATLAADVGIGVLGPDNSVVSGT